MVPIKFPFARFRNSSTSSPESAPKSPASVAAPPRHAANAFLTPWLRFLSGTAAFLILAGGVALAQEAPKKPEKKEQQPATEKSQTDESGSQEIDIPVPIGVPVKGITVPSYGPDGKLQMMLNAQVARKLDDTRIEFEDMKIDAYSDDGRKFYVELPRSIFNLETRVLSGESRVFIRREDFEITGDAGEFHTKTRFAKILGNVKMVVLSAENLETK